VDRESTRLIKKEVFHLWKVLTSDEDGISGPFMPELLATALKHLKPEKQEGLNSIFSEVILHTSNHLLNLGYVISSFPAFDNSKFQRSEKSTNSCNLKTELAIRVPKELSTCISAVFPLQDPRKSPKEQVSFQHGR